MSETRPSRLLLDRYATGELSPDEAANVQARLDDAARVHLAAVEAVDVPPVDVDALRARAAAMPEREPFDAYAPSSLGDPEETQPTPANRPFPAWIRYLSLAVVAAVVLWAVVPQPRLPGDDAPIVQTRGPALSLYVAVDGSLHPYRATPLGEGDVLGFEVAAQGHTGVVLLSVDGTDAVSVYYPTSGNDPEPLPEHPRYRIDGAVTLDGAPGPEVFLAVFDTPVDAVVREVTAVYEANGHAGLLAWADASERAAAVEIQRR